MAGKRDIEAGRAFVRLYHKDELSGPFKKSMRAIGRELKQTAAAVRTLALGMAGAAAAIAVPIAASIKAASDMQEVMSKFNVVFGDNAKAMKEWSDEFAASVGRSKKEVATFLSSTQDLLVPLGFAADDGERLSKQITQLAFDLGSFNNMADADVMRDLQAALTGSGETMKKYGVVVNEAGVKQELLNQKLDPKTATEAQKAFARLQIILRGTTAAQGDAIRTADGFANQWKRMQAVIADTAVEIGERFLPVATLMVEVVGDAILVLSDMSKEGVDGFSEMTISAEGLIDALGTMANAFTKTLATVKYLGAGFHSLKAVLYSLESFKLRLVPGEFARNLREEFAAIAKEANLAAQKLDSEASQLWKSDFSEEFKARLLKLRAERQRELTTPAGGRLTGGGARGQANLLATSPATPAIAAAVPSADVKAAAGGLIRLLAPLAEVAKNAKERGLDLRHAFATEAPLPTLSGVAAAPLGVTFSAEAAMAAGFRGGSPQQKALDDIRKTNAAAVEHLKSIGTGIWRFVDGLVYG